MKYLLIILVAITFLSCTRRKCDDGDFYPVTIYHHKFLLTCVDQSGNNLINNMGTGYDTASIKVYDVNNNLLRRDFSSLGPDQPFGRFKFELVVSHIFDPEDTVYKPVCKRMYINFGNDRDTLDYCFNSMPGPCEPKIIDLTARFNGKIFYEAASVRSYIEATIVK